MALTRCGRMHLIRSMRWFSICIAFVIVVKWWNSSQTQEYFLFRQSNQVENHHRSTIPPASSKFSDLTKNVAQKHTRSVAKFDKIWLENRKNPEKSPHHKNTEEKLSIKKNDGKFISGNESMNEDKTSAKNLKEFYGSDCPANPYKRTLKYILRRWIQLANDVKIKYFLCHGSLLGQYRDGDLIPYDRDMDVCMTDKEYPKLQRLATKKLSDVRLLLAINPDTVPLEKRVRTDCKGRQVATNVDPCTFAGPWARIIFRTEHLDMYVLKELGEYLQDDEHKRTNLARDIFPTKPCMFMQLETQCPRNTRSYLLHYFAADFATKPDFICKNKTWVATNEIAKRKIKVLFG